MTDSTDILLGVTCSVKRSFVIGAFVDVPSEATSVNASSVIEFSVAEKIFVVVSSCKILRVEVVSLGKVLVVEKMLDTFVVATPSVLDSISVLKSSPFLISVVPDFVPRLPECIDFVEISWSNQSVVVRISVDDPSKM